jgi:cell division protein ZapA (FtsZ GTPase activity inhibitor)
MRGTDMEKKNKVNVRILGSDYSFLTNTNDTAKIEDTIHYLEFALNETKKNNPYISNYMALILTCLNLSEEVLEGQKAFFNLQKKETADANPPQKKRSESVPYTATSATSSTMQETPPAEEHTSSSDETQTPPVLSPMEVAANAASAEAQKIEQCQEEIRRVTEELNRANAIIAGYKTRLSEVRTDNEKMKNEYELMEERLLESQIELVKLRKRLIDE